MDDTAKSDYWDSYYGSLALNELHVPSQFAAFVAAEFKGIDLLVDIGCGNGRDSVFFSSFVDNVIGVDSSSSGVDFCNRFAAANGLKNVGFHQATVGTPEFSSSLKKILAVRGDGPVAVYSRFFIHALTEAEEQDFFETVASNLKSGDRLALEYRTVRDASGAKETARHYRRFISPPSIFSILEGSGFGLEYAAEGFGMAKYKVDDAYVARSLHTKL